MVEQILDHLAFLRRPAERNHELQIVQTKIVFHGLHRSNFHLKGRAEFLVQVARRAPPGDHRVLLNGLEDRPAEQLSVFVGFEVREANKNRPRVERRTDEAHAFAKFVDEQVRFVFVRPSSTVQRLNQRSDLADVRRGKRLLVRLQRLGKRAGFNVRLHGCVVDERKRVNAEFRREDEFNSRKTNTVNGKAGIGERLGWEPNVEFDFRR